ncbi:hypothetical protein F383_28999 [Gossypium arboreum]|uniref:Uncharacterized protein n=1 Tax=Gossypium arboreum TaxID=29729 RepID=A0A0B0PGV1_GOSAR|nr:hypothetical protein F383_28999 [Gossypium arboreum]
MVHRAKISCDRTCKMSLMNRYELVDFLFENKVNWSLDM